MVQDGVSAAAASHRIGYESGSQFSCEFKRFFGRTPATEAAVMKNALIQIPAQASPAYFTVQ
jgi:AraC-like DNA-binding protein